MKYIGYYDIEEAGRERRFFSPAARDKMTYIADSIAELEPIEIVSPSGVLGSRSGRAGTTRLATNKSLRVFFSLGRKYRLIGKLSTGLLRVQMFFYLMFCTGRHEKLIVYHSLGYMGLISLAKRIKNLRIILEVEEIYSDVTGNERSRNRELHYFRQANAYIFPTKLLDEALNPSHKPSVIIHGTYQVEQDRKCKFDESMLQVDGARVIHCVYAGTLDPRKGGAVAAAAAEFLPNNYHIHILGFGSDSDVQAMKDHTAAFAKRSSARVTYDGVLSGEEYIRFIQCCDIGLSTQNPDAPFNDTSFPSKVLSYLANGLRVVSIRIPAVEQSAVGDMLTYYDEQTPKEIAKAIMSVELDPAYDSRKRIRELDMMFSEDLLHLLMGNRKI